MKFSTTLLDYDQASQNTILDYEVMVEELGDLDRKLLYGNMGNYSLAGFQFNLKVGGDIYEKASFWVKPEIKVRKKSSFSYLKVSHSNQKTLKEV